MSCSGSQASDAGPLNHQPSIRYHQHMPSSIKLHQAINLTTIDQNSPSSQPSLIIIDPSSSPFSSIHQRHQPSSYHQALNHHLLGTALGSPKPPAIPRRCSTQVTRLPSVLGKANCHDDPWEGIGTQQLIGDSLMTHWQMVGQC